jgi:hypothetical protein
MLAIPMAAGVVDEKTLDEAKLNWIEKYYGTRYMLAIPS